MILTARYVAPVDRPVIEHGAVRLQGSRIIAVGSAGEIDDDAQRRDFGEAIITPGFVNAHTHLELTGLAGRIPPSNDLTDWLTRLVHATRREPPTADSVQEAVARGIDQSLRAGVTTVGDITRFPTWTRRTLSKSVLRAVSFGEVIAIGPQRAHLNDRINEALDADFTGDRLHRALAPHAPYTVEPEALRHCARRAEEIGAPLCIHVAETREEAEFTRRRTGLLADYLRNLGAWDESIPVAHCDPIPLLDDCGLLTNRTVLAHANFVSDDDIACIARTGAGVAYCPRTHDAFGHPPHRFRDMLEAGVNVCIGTDSLASNPTLSILHELRFLHHKFPELGGEALLTLGTLAGAEVLGIAHRVGSITVGKDADLVVLPLPPRADRQDFLTTAGDPLAVLARGIFVLDSR